MGKIKDIIKPYRTSNPEWFSNYRISKGTTNEHYSPKLVEILKNELSKNKNVK